MTCPDFFFGKQSPDAITVSLHRRRSPPIVFEGTQRGTGEFKVSKRQTVFLTLPLIIVFIQSTKSQFRQLPNYFVCNGSACIANTAMQFFLKQVEVNTGKTYSYLIIVFIQSTKSQFRQLPHYIAFIAATYIAKEMIILSAIPAQMPSDYLKSFELK